MTAVLKSLADMNVSNTYTPLSKNLYIFNQKFMKSDKKTGPANSAGPAKPLAVIPEALEQGNPHIKEETKKNDGHKEQVKMDQNACNHFV